MTGKVQQFWSPSKLGTLKVNFDDGNWQGGWGWAFIVRDHLGDLILVGADLNMGFQSPELEEARGC